MSMTIQSSVKDKIYGNFQMRPIQGRERRQQKSSVTKKALSKKERVKPRCVRAMAMTIQYGVRGMILTAQSEAFKQENVLTEILHGTVVMDDAQGSKVKAVMSKDFCLLAIAYAAESVRTTIGLEYCLAYLNRRKRDGQSERMIQTLEDIMRACVIDFLLWFIIEHLEELRLKQYVWKGM
ncbi:hypothetical protein Tco_0412556 [Tanacetum coccineum]